MLALLSQYMEHIDPFIEGDTGFRLLQYDTARIWVYDRQRFVRLFIGDLFLIEFVFKI